MLSEASDSSIRMATLSPRFRVMAFTLPLLSLNHIVMSPVKSTSAELMSCMSVVTSSFVKVKLIFTSLISASSTPVIPPGL